MPFIPPDKTELNIRCDLSARMGCYEIKECCRTPKKQLKILKNEIITDLYVKKYFG
jgi:hypothetical protein